MKRFALFLIFCLSLSVYAQDQKQNQKPATLKSILLEQLKSTHNAKDWFVDGNTAVAGLTPEQATEITPSASLPITWSSGISRSWPSSRANLLRNIAARHI
jgi:hypothetical protein